MCAKTGWAEMGWHCALSFCMSRAGGWVVLSFWDAWSKRQTKHSLHAASAFHDGIVLLRATLSVAGVEWMRKRYEDMVDTAPYLSLPALKFSKMTFFPYSNLSFPIARSWKKFCGSFHVRKTYLHKRSNFNRPVFDITMQIAKFTHFIVSRFNYIYWPSRAGQHSFALPLDDL